MNSFFGDEKTVNELPKKERKKERDISVLFPSLCIPVGQWGSYDVRYPKEGNNFIEVSGLSYYPVFDELSWGRLFLSSLT